MSLTNLYDCSWYWGDLDWRWAEKLLTLCADGTFLVRDSRSSTHLFTVSYIIDGKVLHTRISLESTSEHLGRQKPFISNDYKMLRRVIEDSIQVTQDGQREMLVHRRGGEADAQRVALTRPLSKRDLLPSLQYLCRFAIRTRHPSTQYLNRIGVIPPRVFEYLADSKWITPELEKCEQTLKQMHLYKCH